MKINDEFEVTIDDFSNLAKGVTRIDGQVVFVDNACPDDVVKIKINHVNKNYADADITEIIKPSKYRVEPFCPMQKVCGACQMQYIDYDYQLELKHKIVIDVMKKIGGIDTEVNFPIRSPKTKNYRQKIQYPAGQTKNSKRILAGYYKPQSHDIVNIKYCPIQPEICDKIVDFIRENFPKNYGKDLRHIVIRGSEYSSEYLVTLVVKREFNGLKDFAESLFNEFKAIKGVCINLNDKNTNVILSDKTKCFAGESFIEEKILDKVFKIGANTFFQVNPKSAENIFKYVRDEIAKSENPAVLDAYAGIAVFGAVVSDVAKSVVSVEENRQSVELAQDVLKMNNIDNVELYNNDTLKYLKSIKRKFDTVILDPPRKGCTDEVLDEVLNHLHKNSEKSGKIIYVSCNPATLARDLKYLKSKGCTIESLQPFDMFCHTYHIETVAVITL